MTSIKKNYWIKSIKILFKTLIININKHQARLLKLKDVITHVCNLLYIKLFYHINYLISITYRIRYVKRQTILKMK